MKGKIVSKFAPLTEETGNRDAGAEWEPTLLQSK